MSQENTLEKLSKDRRFGTDGIRGPIETTMNPLFIAKLAWSAGRVLKEEGIASSILIGKDTRISGYMLESALQAGFISSGMNVILLGPLPTPAVAYLAKSNNKAGVVISASHNSFEDNGLKFFNKDGYKISSSIEKKIEQKYSQPIKVVEAINLGKAERLSDAKGRYIEFCKSSTPNLDLSGVSLVLDCANGSTYAVAPKIFSEMGAKVTPIAVEPDGININEKCGSTNPQLLQETVLSTKSTMGIAFDGDGDRLLVVDSKGRILDGDDLLYTLILSNITRKKEEFLSTGVVGTLMTNKALEVFLKEQGVGFTRTDVGDKFVLEELKRKNWILGGEPSGHIICLDSTTTGDAIVAALSVLDSIKEFDFNIHKVLKPFKKFPQKLINLQIKSPQTVMMDTQVRQAVGDMESSLGSNGRVLIRPSGTEPLIRIMVEANNLELANNSALKLANLFSRLG